jgi:hypothetical protein
MKNIFPKLSVPLFLRVQNLIRVTLSVVEGSNLHFASLRLCVKNLNRS